MRGVRRAGCDAFQALIGTAKTDLHPAGVDLRKLVSSPHRYCQNICTRRASICGSWFQALIGTAKTVIWSCIRRRARRFQALIGTAKTQALEESPDVSLEFQALIGTAKTHSGARITTIPSEFQALIGTAKTWGRSAECRYGTAVSSPHRYCQNSGTRRAPAAVRRFQALIGTAKTRVRAWAEWMGEVSSPHRYCQNLCSARNSSLNVCVSSPHRYCQNDRNGKSTKASSSFQALIGTAKTSAAIARSCSAYGFKPS